MHSNNNYTGDPPVDQTCIMVNFTILAGGYTSFVASYLFNSDTNALTLLNQSPTRANPFLYRGWSWAMSLTNGSVGTACFHYWLIETSHICL